MRKLLELLPFVKKTGMLFTYDPVAQMGYVYLRATHRQSKGLVPVETIQLSPEVWADYSIETGELLGVEIFEPIDKQPKH